MDKSLTIKDRILTFIESKGISRSQFYNKTGIEPSNFKGRNKESMPGSAMLVKIITIYRDISPDWLLTGEGPMLRDCAEKSEEDNIYNKEKNDREQHTSSLMGDNNNTTGQKNNQQNMVDKLLSIIDKKDDIIRQQAEDIGQLRAELAQLKQRIQKSADAANTDITANAV